MAPSGRRPAPTATDFQLSIGARSGIRQLSRTATRGRQSHLHQDSTGQGAELCVHYICRLKSVVEAKETPVASSPKDTFDPKTFLAKVGAGKTIVEFHKSQNVFEQGELANAVFYIQKGKVKMTVLSEQGKEAVVAILGAGEFFGEGCLNGHKLRISTTTAMEDCIITSITKAAMIAAIHDEPKFSELFMAYLLTRNSRIEEDLIDQLFNSSERRLARLLLLLANFGKEGSPQPINPHISQETLAEMIGTTRSRVSHFMNKFRKLGLISYNGHIEVNSSLLSAVLHEKPLLKERD